MKRFLTLITILALSVAILCGCNHESKEKDVVSETQSSHTASQNEQNTESIKETNAFDSNDDINIDYTDAYSPKNNDNLIPDSTEKSHNEAVNNKETTDSNHTNSATEKVYETIATNSATAKNEVNEAEIDFSDLE